jgi:hypothetical protein
VEQFVEDTLEMSPTFGATLAELGQAQRQEVLEHVSKGARRFVDEQGRLVVPGLALVGLASA